MATDDERRRVAAALRAYDGKGVDADTIGEVTAIIIGACDADGWSWREIYARLADLIEPSEPKVKCVAEVKIDDERLEQLAHDAAVELTGIDRDALLALADEMDDACPESASVAVVYIDDYARRIREALGLGERDAQ